METLWIITCKHVLSRLIYSVEWFIVTGSAWNVMRPMLRACCGDTGKTCQGPLQWRHSECDGVSNNRRLDWLLNRLFRRWSKKTSKFRVTGLCEGNSPLTEEFPAQRISNEENNSIWWRHQIIKILTKEHNKFLHVARSRSVVVRCVIIVAMQMPRIELYHYHDVIMSAMASQMTSLTIVCAAVY